MSNAKIIYHIDAEQQFAVLVRILARFSRHRVSVLEFSSQLNHHNARLRITVVVEQSEASALNLSRRLHREVDIFSVHVFHLIN